MIKLLVVETADGSAGPLDGPFTFVTEAPGGGSVDSAHAELVELVVGFVRQVAAGVSSYNKSDPEASSNLRSYAQECFEELKSETPDAAARLEDLRIDCRRLPQRVKEQPIWKLDRAILRMLPGADFIE